MIHVQIPTAKVEGWIPSASPVGKDPNPKDIVGSTKLGLDLVPDTLTSFAALSFTEGALKYGSYNWRVTPVRASIYTAALKRHLKKWWNGEWCDPITKVPHLASVIACAGIVLDAGVVGTLVDDRPPVADLGKLIAEHEAIVANLKVLHKDANPTHYHAKQA